MWLGEGTPWALAGHAVGGFALVETGRAPYQRPRPGAGASHTPLVWYDSVTVVAGEGGGWDGFDAGLARVVGHGGLDPGSGTRAVLDLRNGSFTFDENSLVIARADSSYWLRAGAMAGTRGPVQSLSLFGRHMWEAAAGFRRGRHRLDGAYAQRGTGNLLNDDIEDRISGESGAVTYAYGAGGWSGSLRLERGRDEHQSLGILLPSIRLAQESAAIAELEGASRFGAWGLRAAYRQSEVKRGDPDDPAATEGRFEVDARSGWLGARLERGFDSGVLRIETGAGRHDAVDGVQVAPAVSYRTRAGVLDARIGAERVVQPVWSDLAADVEPFLQSTWAGVLEAGFGGGGNARGSLNFMFGRTEDRALVPRHPSQEVWLRLGTTRETEPHDFGLLRANGTWEGRRWSAGGEGFVLARDYGGVQSDMDPPYAFRAWAGARASFFGGDLGLQLRLQLDGVGERVSQGPFPELCGIEPTEPLPVLPGYVTSGFTLSAQVKSSIITFRMRNLENRAQPEPWVDCETLEEASGPGREFRFALTLWLDE